jgi:two-component system invasion response regulator UvrY
MKLLLVEDHPIFRLGVRQLILGRWPDAVIDEAGTLAEALAAGARGTP